ncbi:MAG: hypothetical protein ACI8YQ_005285, partial [Polaribacter sp.]
MPPPSMFVPLKCFQFSVFGYSTVIWTEASEMVA